MNFTNIPTTNTTYTIADPCKAAFGEYANAFNMGLDAALGQVSLLLYFILAGILVIMFAPMFEKYAKTEQAKNFLGVVQSAGLFLAFACAVLAVGMQFINMSMVAV